MKIKRKIEVRIPMVNATARLTSLIEVADVWVPFMKFQYNVGLAGGIKTLRRAMVNIIKRSPTPGTFTKYITLWTHACMKRDGELLLSGWAYASNEGFDDYVQPWLRGESILDTPDEEPAEGAMF